MRISNPYKLHLGFALPMTILAVAGLTLLLIGLMTVLTLERKTARSYSDAGRADLAVESGLAVALASLSEIAKRDDSIVFRIEDPVQPTIASSQRPLGFREQFFTYGALYENGQWRGIPLFSGAPETSLGSLVPDTVALRQSLGDYVKGQSDPLIALGNPSEHEQSIPRAKWVDLPTATVKDYTTRYAYWVEDLSGRIDGTVAGSEPRTLGLGPAEIPLAPLFEASGADDAKALVKDRAKFRTSGSIRTKFKSDTAKRSEANLIYENLSQLEPSHERVVPSGFGYVDEGTPTADLNEFVANADVGGIANSISRNIPTFSNRRGAMGTPDDYLNTLAANIIDYADTDTLPTIIPVANGRGIRGIDSYPFVNIIVDRYKRVQPETGKSNQVAVEVRTFVELWNPSDQEITGKITLNNIDKVGVTIGGPRFFNDRVMSPDPEVVTLAPNQHKVLEMLVSGVAPVFRFDNNFQTVVPYTLLGSSTNKFELFWNDLLVDATASSGGMNRAKGIPNLRDFNEENDVYASGNIPPLIFPPASVGDPRITYYIKRTFSVADYSGNTAWGGRNKLSDVGVEVELDPGDPPSSSGWADGGHDSALGLNPGSNSWLPGANALEFYKNKKKQRPYKANEPLHAPTKISNAGQFVSVCELGNIFDPAQVTNVRAYSTGTGLVAGNGNGGGGFTLAIGRIEFPAFDREGLRAAQLLDLFSIQQPPNARIGRKVNINTAPAEVLRTLVAGQQLVADETQAKLFPPEPANEGDKFERQVIATRNAAPLRGYSDLALINPPRPPENLSRRPDQPPLSAAEASSYFGNHNLYPATGSRPGSDWKDSGREEHLARFLNLVKFNSNLFRVVVIGQAVSSDRRTILGTKRMEFHYAVFPERLTDGTVDSSKPAKIYKLYANEI